MARVFSFSHRGIKPSNIPIILTKNLQLHNNGPILQVDMSVAMPRNESATTLCYLGNRFFEIGYHIMASIDSDPIDRLEILPEIGVEIVLITTLSTLCGVDIQCPSGVDKGICFGCWMDTEDGQCWNSFCPQFAGNRIWGKYVSWTWGFWTGLGNSIGSL